MKNKLRLFFIFWWLSAVIMPLVVSYYNLQYDAGGFEGGGWWLTFLISFPFGVVSEYVVEILSDSSSAVQMAVSYILGSLFIYLLYLFISYVGNLKRKNS